MAMSCKNLFVSIHKAQPSLAAAFAAVALFLREREFKTEEGPLPLDHPFRKLENTVITPRRDENVWLSSTYSAGLLRMSRFRPHPPVFSEFWRTARALRAYFLVNVVSTLGKPENIDGTTGFLE